MNGKDMYAVLSTRSDIAWELLSPPSQHIYEHLAAQIHAQHITPLQGRIDALESRQAMCEYTHAQILARLENEKQALQALVQDYQALTRCLPMDKGGREEWNAERDALQKRAQALRGEGVTL